MHAKADSDVTSITASSPSRSPRRPVYYVQSPSHDGEKTTSFHSTPIGSPHHSHSSIISNQFSGKITPNEHSRVNHQKTQQSWKDYDVIEEESLVNDQNREKKIPRRCYILGFVLAFILLFSIFSLILLGVSKPMKPMISMKSISFEYLTVQAGSDSTGVATDLISMNSTVKFTYRNTASFFGVHVTSTPLDLSYSQLKIGSGKIKKFYQSRKSERTITVSVMSDKIPLYGNGAGLISSSSTAKAPVPMKLNFVVRSRAYVLGKLVKPKFYRKIDCFMNFDSKKLNVPISLKNCTYR